MSALVCLITLLGSACSPNAMPTGICFELFSKLLCFEEVGNIPLWSSTYDPSEGGINCNDDCLNKATGPVLESQYGHTAACATDWLFLTIVTEYGEFLCDDRGGAIHLTWRTVYDPILGFYDGWFWVTDFMIHSDELPYWAYQPIYEWSFKHE